MTEKYMSSFYRQAVTLGCTLIFSTACLADGSYEPPQLSEAQYNKLLEVYARIKSEYVVEVDDDQLINNAVKGMVAGLDPNSSYLDFEAMKDNGVPNHGVFGGLGIEVAMEAGLVKVVSPIEDTPAYRAGIRAGDLITHIDHTPVKGLSLADAIMRLRGEPETTVRISIERKNSATPLTFSIVRKVIQNPSVKYKLVDQDYPYLRVTQFREHTGEDLAKALVDIRAQNKVPLKGLVLDMRNNPGGSIAASVAVASAFLKKDALVVTSEGRSVGARMRLFANPDNYVEGGAENDYMRDVPPEIKAVPLVVLVNGGSASASEIVTGALQDHKRATIIGTQTYGKGTIQTLLPLSTGSAIKLTIARYFTPSGRSIQTTGITPDVVVNEVQTASADSLPVEPASQQDVQYQRAIAYLKGH